MVNPPKKVINRPPNSGTIGTLFSKIQTTNKAIIVAIINGTRATLMSLPLL